MKKIIFSTIFVFTSFITQAQEKGLDKKIDEAFAPVSEFFSKTVFFEIAGYPFVILLLIASAAFLHYILDFQILDISKRQLMLLEVNMTKLKKMILVQKTEKFLIFKL